MSRLLSKIVVPEIESKSQPLNKTYNAHCGCYQRSLFLKLKANHNWYRGQRLFFIVVIKDRCSWNWKQITTRVENTTSEQELLSKIVVPEIESKSQPVCGLGFLHRRCYQRSLFLKLKANHNLSCNCFFLFALLSKIVVPEIESKSQHHLCIVQPLRGWWCFNKMGATFFYPPGVLLIKGK